MAKRKVTFKMNAPLALAVAYIVVGILFCIFKGAVLNWIMTAIGVLFIVQGVLDIVARNTVSGVIEIAVGALCIVFGWVLVQVAMIILGAVVIANGIVGLLRNKGVMAIVINILAIVFGVLLIINYWTALDWMFIVIGVFCIANQKINTKKEADEENYAPSVFYWFLAVLSGFSHCYGKISYNESASSFLTVSLSSLTLNRTEPPPNLTSTSSPGLSE